MVRSRRVVGHKLPAIGHRSFASAGRDPLVWGILLFRDVKVSLPSAPGSSPPSKNAETFAARYCATHGIARAAYGNVVLRAALYPHARLLRLLLPRRGLAVDRDFVESVGHLQRMEDFHDKARDFLEDPNGHTWLREVLHLRVSARRLRRIVRETLLPG